MGSVKLKDTNLKGRDSLLPCFWFVLVTAEKLMFSKHLTHGTVEKEAAELGHLCQLLPLLVPVSSKPLLAVIRALGPATVSCKAHLS